MCRRSGNASCAIGTFCSSCYPGLETILVWLRLDSTGLEAAIASCPVGVAKIFKTKRDHHLHRFPEDIFQNIYLN